MMNAEPLLHQENDLTGINDGSLSDGSRGTVLNLVSSDSSPKTLVFVKLTDSSIKAIVDFLEAKNHGSTANARLIPRISFDQNTKGGSLHFPSPNSTPGQDWKWKKFSFSLLPLNDGGPRGSFECIRQRKADLAARNYKSSSPMEGQLLESLGPMSYKMQVSGCEESFENTRARMFDITQNSLKNSAKEIEQNNAGPNIGRKIKQPPKLATNGNGIHRPMANGRPAAVQHDKLGPQSKMPYRTILNKNQDMKDLKDLKSCSTSGGTTSSTSLSESSSLHNNNNLRLSSPSMPCKRPTIEAPNGNGPAVKKPRFACDNGLPHHGRLEARGSLNSTPNSSPGSSAGASSEDSHAATTDYKSMYTKILSPEQRQRYEMDFERDYKEYYRQHAILDKIKQKFVDYEQQLYQYEESSEEWQRIVDTIYTEYEQLKSDRNWIRARNDVRFLHDKLNHIRQLIIEYDSST